MQGNITSKGLIPTRRRTAAVLLGAVIGQLCARSARGDEPVEEFDNYRDIDLWAAQRSLRLQWSADDVVRLSTGGPARAIFEYVHSHPERRLGNTIAFFEMYLGRRLNADELAGYHVRLESLELHPNALEELVRFADGLFRIDDSRIADDGVAVDFENYAQHRAPEDRLTWYFGNQQLFGIQPTTSVGVRRRDWIKADYDALPKERYLAFIEAMRLRPNPGMHELQALMARLVFQREPNSADFIDNLIFVPSDMPIHPDGFHELCAFVREQARVRDLTLPDDWRHKYPEMIQRAG